MNVPGWVRFAAASLHLGYLPVAFGFGYALIQPTLALNILGLALLYTVLVLLAFRWEPKNEFLREHLHQARSYHNWGGVTAVSFFAAAMYVAVFTWGLGALVALCLAPIAILCWIIPTWSAAYDALRGRPHQYQVWSHEHVMSMLRGHHSHI